MIFCIGLSKTGTRSLAEALSVLGYNVVHGSWEVNQRITGNITEGRSPLAGLGYQAYADIPAVISLFHRLDRRYPAKFIYTGRDETSWIASRQRHLQGHPQTRKWYWFDHTPQQWAEEKARHEARLKAHFEGSDNLLHMNIFAGDGYPELCQFLGRDVPESPFPHVK